MLSEKKGILFTLGNVTVNEKTLFTFPSDNPDPRTNNRSQELYDALSKRMNIYAWGCGRYGQHVYSPELGQQFAEELSKRIKKKNLKYDFSIQMAGHPVMSQPCPFFLIVDFIPFFDLSIMDELSFPYVVKTNEMDQDFLYQKATGIITYTPVQRYMLINWFQLDPCKVTSICSGINSFTESTKVKNQNKHILWVGADYNLKGGEDTILAYQNLKKYDDEYSLTMVGIDPAIIQDKSIRVVPFLHGSDLSLLDSLYDEAGVFVLPSYKENLGLVYLEAMAHKTPIVVTSRGGFAEIVRRMQCGKIVKPGNVLEIQKAIQEICETENYEKLSERAYSFVNNNARWEIASERIYDAIERWLTGYPVPDDYNNYSVSETIQSYNQYVNTNIR